MVIHAGLAQDYSTYYEKGLLFLEKGKLENGYESFSTAASLSEKQRDWPLYFKALAKCGESGYALSGVYEQRALGQLKAGLRHVDKHKNDSLGDFYFYLGNIYRELTVETDSALHWLEKARLIYEKQHGENAKEVARCYSAMGWVNRYQRFDLFEAQRCFERSLSVWEKVAGNHDSQLADNYYNLAVTYRPQGELEKSISYATRALQLVRKLNAIEFEGACHSLFGTIYMDMDSLSLAEEEIKRAIEINLSSNQNPGDLIRYYYSMGLICDRLGQLERGKEYMSKSIAIGRQRNLDQYQKFGIVNAWLLLSDLLVKNNETEAAFDALQKARRQLVFLVGKQKAEDVQLLYSFSEYFFRTHQLDSALFYNQRALKSGIKGFHPVNNLWNPSITSLKNNFYMSSSSMKNNVYLPDVIFRKAEILTALYRTKQRPEYLKASLECFALTEELLTRSRNAFDFDQAKWRTSDAYFKVYETPIEALMEIYTKNKNDSIAALLFQYMEKSKSKTLRDALAVAESYKKSNLPDSIILSLRVLQDRQRKAQNDIDEALLNSTTNVERISSLRLLITDIDKKLKEVREYVQVTYPDYYRLKYSYAVTSLPEVQQYAQQNGLTLLEFFYGKDHVYGMAITGSSVEVIKLGTSESITKMISKFSDHFSMSNRTSQSDRFLNFVQHSFALYETLLAPFGVLPSPKVVIVSDGLLSAIPFEALLVSRPPEEQVNYRSLPYLINSKEVSYAFFATSLFRESPKRTGRKMLGLAYSGYASNAEIARRNENSISGTSTELDAIKAIFKTGVFLRDTSATEEIFKDLAPDFDLLHLALHGHGDDKNANLSYLLFRNSVVDSVNDGKLHAYELYGLNLKARLAVLSACETGLGKTIRTEGTFSMANAFAYSGCPNVIMSLWKVNDQTTAEVMNSFYEYFADGSSIDESLTHAKRIYIQHADELTADPALWASFVAVGDMQYQMATPPSVGQIMAVLLGGVLLVLVIFLLRTLRRRYIVVNDRLNIHR